MLLPDLRFVWLIHVTYNNTSFSLLYRIPLIPLMNIWVLSHFLLQKKVYMNILYMSLCVSVCVCVDVWIYVCVFVGYIPRSEIAKLLGSSIQVGTSSFQSSWLASTPTSIYENSSCSIFFATLISVRP